MDGYRAHKATFGKKKTSNALNNIKLVSRDGMRENNGSISKKTSKTNINVNRGRKFEALGLKKGSIG